MVELGVDHVGSVILEETQWKSDRIKATVELVQSAGRKSSLIPLMRSTDAISRLIDYYQADIIHFCEAIPRNQSAEIAVEDVIERQSTIRERFPEVELMRSIPIGCNGQGDIIPSLHIAAELESLSDWFLTDTLLGSANDHSNTQQPVQGFVGITGQTCDWTVAAQLVEQSSIPVILAGGIGPHNVESAIVQVRPSGVDSCTLTNAIGPQGAPERFHKDHEKVAALVQKARQATGKMDINEHSRRP